MIIPAPHIDLLTINNSGTHPASMGPVQSIQSILGRDCGTFPVLPSSSIGDPCISALGKQVMSGPGLANINTLWASFLSHL